MEQSALCLCSSLVSWAQSGPSQVACPQLSSSAPPSDLPRTQFSAESLGVLCIDVWDRDFAELGLDRRGDGPACGQHHYEYLAGERTSWTTVLCGRNAVQIAQPEERDIPLEALRERLTRIGSVEYNGFLLSFAIGDKELVVFPTGRALVRGTTAEAEARTLYTRYVGVWRRGARPARPARANTAPWRSDR